MRKTQPSLDFRDRGKVGHEKLGNFHKLRTNFWPSRSKEGGGAEMRNPTDQSPAGNTDDLSRLSSRATRSKLKLASILRFLSI